MTRRVSISDLKDMVAWKKSRHQNPAFWERRLQEATVEKLKSEVRARRRKEREAQTAGAEA